MRDSSVLLVQLNPTFLQDLLFLLYSVVFLSYSSEVLFPAPVCVMSSMRGIECWYLRPLLCRSYQRSISQLGWIQFVIANHATPSSSIPKSNIGKFIRLALGEAESLLALLCWNLHPSCSHPGRVSGWVSSLSFFRVLGLRVLSPGLVGHTSVGPLLQSFGLQCRS